MKKSWKILLLPVAALVVVLSQAAAHATVLANPSAIAADVLLEDMHW